MEKIISIVIPTYNMENYLERCLSSVVIDKRTDRVEAIVVNDGSQDNSLSIAMKFAEEHPDVFRIIDKPNNNYGSCINAALNMATGKYIKVLDADDCFDNACFCELVDLLEKTDVDLVLNDKMEVRPDCETLNALKYTQTGCFDFFEESDIKLFDSIMMHNVIYRKSIFDKIDYKQSEGIFYTDNEWISSPMASVKTAFHFSKPLYRYTLGREGQSVDENVVISHINDEISMSTKLISDHYYTKYPSDKARELMMTKLYYHMRWVYKLIIVENKHLDSRILLNLDAAIKHYNPHLYQQLNNERLKVFMFHIRYIKLWRMNRNSKFFKFIMNTK